MSPRKPKEAAKSSSRKREREVAPAAQLVSEPVVAEQVDRVPATAPPVAAPIVDPGRIVVFALDAQRYALPIDVVQEIQQIVAISQIPDASPSIVGVINLRGQIVPVVDLRALLGLGAASYGLQTPMILTKTSCGLVALIVDEVEDVVEVASGSMQQASNVYALAERLLGVCRLEDGLVFVFDIDALVPPSLASLGGS